MCYVHFKQRMLPTYSIAYHTKCDKINKHERTQTHRNLQIHTFIAMCIQLLPGSPRTIDDIPIQCPWIATIDGFEHVSMAVNASCMVWITFLQSCNERYPLSRELLCMLIVSKVLSLILLCHLFVFAFGFRWLVFRLQMVCTTYIGYAEYTEFSTRIFVRQTE